MSDKTLQRAWRAVRLAATTNMTVLVAASSVLAVAYSSTARGQDVTSILAASRELAEAAPLDLTRLALQVALASILGNVVLVVMAFRLMFGFARKPCLLVTQEARAILREAVRQATHDNGDA